jgi:NADH-quinone oxidoreductase subunit H
MAEIADLFWAIPTGLRLTLEIVFTVLVLLGCFAYVTYAERKVLGAIQLRQGPITVGPFGLLQPIADGVKLLSKETIIPAGANPVIFVLAPMVMLTLALIAWAVIPFDAGVVFANINVGVLYLFAISSLGVYGVIMAGWSSNSKYSFLGAMRSAAQMVSYEVSMGLVIVTQLLIVGSLNLTDIVEHHSPVWLWILQLPMLVIFFISALAETNRAPFDLPEGESELVGGFNTEYSSMTFALFFIAEYLNMILMSAITTVLFLGGYKPPFGLEIAPLTWIPGILWFALKIAFLLFVFIWVRGTVPRYRYDQLMRLGWKIFLPFSLIWVLVIAGTLMATGMLPVRS